MSLVEKRPLGITIISIWFVLEGIYFFYQNSVGMFGGQDLTNLFEGTILENSFAAYGLVLALFNFVMAWGFWERRPWIRIPTVVILSATLAITVVLASFRLAGIFETVLSSVLLGIVVIYLMKPNVREYFAYKKTGAPIR